MADVSVEFGASDTGLAQTLKTIQTELATLEEQQKTTAMSAEEFQKSLSKIKQLEGLEAKIQGMAQATREVAEAAKAAAEPARDLSEEFKKISEPLLTVNERLSKTRSELADLKDKASTAYMRTEELEDALKKISELEGTERRLAKIAKETDAAGNAAGAAEPKLDALGNSANNAGNKAENSAGMFDASFTKIASAFTVGNLAAKGFEAIIDGVFSAGRAIVDGFSQALDLGGRLSELSSRTGETAGKLLVLETAFKNAGLSGDQVGTVINKLQNFMQDAANGGDKQKAAMDNLGISLSALAGKTPTQQMEVFAAKIAAIEDPTARAAAASEVFGDKLGGKLLPLLNDFSPALDDAREKVGSMEQVMDENAATFDAAGETIDAVKGKMAAFAAGVLSEAIPAVSGLGEEMAKVDFASFGEQVGEALVGKLEKFKDTTAGASEVVKTLNTTLGNAVNAAIPVDNAFEKVGDSTVELYNGFEKARSYTSFFGAALDLLTTYGSKLRISQDSATEGVNTLGAAAESAAPILDTTSAAADGVATSLNAIGGDSGGAFASINEGATTFKSLIDDGKVSLSDMTGEISSQIPLSTQHAEIMGEINVSLGEANVKAGEQLDTIEKQIAAEQERNNKIAARQADSLAEINTQNQINAALAAGNTTLAASLEAKKKHADLTEKIMKDTGLSKDKAGELATETINVANAAQQAKNNAGGLTTNIANAKTAATNIKPELTNIGTLLGKINGTDAAKPVKDLTAETKTAATDLKGISKIINVDISGGSPVDMMKNLGLDPYAVTGSKEQLDAINTAINILKNADPADLTPKVDQVGVQDNIDAIQTYIKSKLGGTTTANIEATADKNAVNTAAGDIKDKVGSISSQITTQTDDNNIQSTKATIEKDLSNVTAVVAPKVDGAAQQSARTELEKIATDVPMTVKADQAQIDNAVGALQAEIRNEFTGGEGGPGGEGGQGGEGGVGGDADADVTSITNIIDPWTKILEAIRDSLPMTALA